jgi:hypothetical protein
MASPTAAERARQLAELRHRYGYGRRPAPPTNEELIEQNAERLRKTINALRRGRLRAMARAG